MFLFIWGHIFCLLIAAHCLNELNVGVKVLFLIMEEQGLFLKRIRDVNPTSLRLYLYLFKQVNDSANCELGEIFTSEGNEHRI
jgi:hypothetical protein